MLTATRSDSCSTTVMKIRNAELKQRTEERDRLRDLVKRMANLVGEAPIDWFGESFVDTQVLLREVRAVLGEETK